MKSYFKYIAILIILFSITKIQSTSAAMTDAEMDLICNIEFPKYATRLCNNEGVYINPQIMTMPRLCKENNKTDKIKIALDACHSPNFSGFYFNELFKFAIETENEFKKAFTERIRIQLETENNNISPAMSGNFFSEIYSACGSSEKCFRKVLDLLPPHSKKILIGTDSFCDFSKDKSLNDMNKFSEYGVMVKNGKHYNHPTCITHYCHFNKCDDKDKSSPIFILDKRWDEYYSIVYKGEQ